ncbi:NAD-dependent epimerase/dehydratase family protein [Acidiphilium iwatense]|uniref:NAD-dependent epimerase/dehydratase family protein n=1 Tax=Acidiphilium iwatense TaxID=768198 RepID=A0ABS9DZZ2_9PROT|nr:NAD-dependent epimerase/dehydratase family protein [Acidiphilium iwatense]MCF3947007.1 NAD-dependent epimerase/dehydratase family protein [Acidiphilium iwatense]
MNDDRRALVLGVTGGVGDAVARVLCACGWRVTALHRDPARARIGRSDIDWVRGDAMNGKDVHMAARGCDLIVHAVNPPGYRNWRGLALPMLRNTIAAASAQGALILFPGNIYNYGPDAFPLLGEASPQNPLTRKGSIRVAMERELTRAADAGVRSLIVRAGDFFGPHAGNSWFSRGLVKAGAPLRSVTYPGRPDAGHAWAYLPDLAETMVRLAERANELAPFETFHFAGHGLPRGLDMAEAIRRVVERPDLPVRKFPWPAAYLAAPFVITLREMLEMRYLWRETVLLDNTKLTAFLGAEPHTPLDDAMRASLQGLGCLEPGYMNNLVNFI